MKTRAFIFDLDGVLTNTAHYHFIAWQTIATRLGIAFDAADNEALKGVDRIESLQRILAKGELTLAPEQFSALLQQKNQHYLALIDDINERQLFPGVLSCFEQLKSKNINIGLASASKNAALVVAKLGIANYFDFLGDANKVANSKPAPDIFLSVAQGLNLAPAQCVGIEDAIAGISAINAAGMLAVGIGDAEVLDEAVLVYPTIQNLDIEAILAAHASAE